MSDAEHRLNAADIAVVDALRDRIATLERELADTQTERDTLQQENHRLLVEITDARRAVARATSASRQD